MTPPVRIVYAGAPEFAVAPLKALHQAGYDIVAVYTQPDRPAGRGREARATPVKQAAQALGIPVMQPQKLSSVEDQQALAELQPDLMVVTAYGLLLPKAVLGIPRLGCINIHASLLPRWRGAAPIQRAILAGDKTTGVTIMQMDEGLDTGDMLLRRECAIRDDDTGSSLHDRLMQLGADALLECLPDLLTGNIQPQKQDEALACYAHKLSKQEAELDWTQSAVQLERCVRAYNAWPVAFTRYRKKGKAETLRVWRAQVVQQQTDAAPGSVLACNKHGIDVACGEGVLRLQQVQPAGKRQMPATDFANAHDITGQVLGEQ